MRELFIYYRSPEEHAAAVQARVHEFQARLRRDHPALIARLLRRPAVKSGLITWMETYAIDAMTFGPRLDDALLRQIETHAQCLNDVIDGQRHTEVFVPCAC